MWWIIIGIIIFLITAYVHKHTYTYRKYDYDTYTYKYNEKDKIPFPIWLLIIIFIVSFIPCFNIGAFIVGFIMYLVGLGSDGIYFAPTGVIKRLLDFLNKKV